MNILSWYLIGSLLVFTYLEIPVLGKKISSLIDFFNKTDDGTESVKTYVKLALTLLSWAFVLMVVHMELTLLYRMWKKKKSYYETFNDYVNEHNKS